MAGECTAAAGFMLLVLISSVASQVQWVQAKDSAGTVGTGQGQCRYSGCTGQGQWL